MMPALVLLWALGLDAGVSLPVHGAADSGSRVSAADDADLAENLELLELFDTADDFELMRELSLER